MTTPHVPIRTVWPLLASAILLVPCAATIPAAASDKGSDVRNLGAPDPLDAPALEVAISRGALRLSSLQVGDWSEPGADLPLSDLPGVVPPCRALSVDAGAATLCAVCPDEDRVPRLVLAQQGAVLRFSRELLEDGGPSLSDDGTRLAVVTREGETDILRVLDLQQTLELSVTGLEAPRRPVLAGSGSAVACTAIVDGERHAVLIDLEAGGARVLSGGQKEVRVGAISGNGRRVVFRGVGRPGDLLYLADVERGTLHSLTEGKGVPVAVDLSQHGDTVAFVERIGGAMGLFSVDVNARKVVNLAGFFEPVRDVIVSATGDRLAFVSGTSSSQVEVLDVAGRAVEEVDRLADGCTDPTLSSDGLFVVALCDAGGRAASVIRLFPLPIDE